MLEYDFDILHVKGKDNLVPDILSRIRREPQLIHQLNLSEEGNNLETLEDDEEEEDYFLQSKSFPLKAQRDLHQAHGRFSGHVGVDLTFYRVMIKNSKYWEEKNT